MGTVYAEITLKNAADSENFERGSIKEEEVRSATVTAIADTGSMLLVITEELRQKLGLRVTGERTAHIANGEQVSCKVTEAVDILWKDRSSTQRAIVIPGAKTVLLGAIPLEDMDLIVNPTTRELVGAHGDTIEVLAL